MAGVGSSGDVGEIADSSSGKEAFGSNTRRALSKSIYRAHSSRLPCTEKVKVKRQITLSDTDRSDTGWQFQTLLTLDI
jgi:hypothetical protein